MEGRQQCDSHGRRRRRQQRGHHWCTKGAQKVNTGVEADEVWNEVAKSGQAVANTVLVAAVVQQLERGTAQQNAATAAPQQKRKKTQQTLGRSLTAETAARGYQSNGYHGG